MSGLLDPAILFFVMGVVAGGLRSNLEIPAAIAKFLSLYLLMALGLKGGFALAHTQAGWLVLISLLAAIFMAFLVPAFGYLFLKRYASKFDAAAVAASYGSVSAVTFVTAMQVLESNAIVFGGYMTAAMVLMESPAIIMAVLLANRARSKMKEKTVFTEQSTSKSTQVSALLHESFTDGAQLLLLGAMLIGLITGETGKTVMQPFSGDLFKGMLSFFLLDMGLMVSRNFQLARQASRSFLAYALCAPWIHACIALMLAVFLHLSLGDGVLLMVLSASASYIVVPAVLRQSVPEANPALYFGLSLGITFPMNLLIGIPAYLQMAKMFLQ